MKLVLVSRDLLLEPLADKPVLHRSQAIVNVDSVKALVKLNDLADKIILLSHQPGISRGLLDLDELEAIHGKIIAAVEQAGGTIDAIFYCPHDQQDRCHCHPPETGLLDVIEMEYDCNCADATFFYHTDLEAKMIRRKGCRGIVCELTNNAFATAVKKLL